MRIQAIFAGMGAQPAYRGLDILDLSRRFGFSAQSVIDIGHGIAPAQKLISAGHADVMRFVTEHECAAVYDEHHRERAQPIRQVEVELLRRRGGRIGEIRVLRRRDRDREIHPRAGHGAGSALAFAIVWSRRESHRRLTSGINRPHSLASCRGNPELSSRFPASRTRDLHGRHVRAARGPPCLPLAPAAAWRRTGWTAAPARSGRGSRAG